MVDTVKTLEVVHDTLYIKGAEGLDVLNKTDAFYNNAWTKLIVFWTILAILVPAVITWLQKQTLKRDSDTLKKEIKEEILKAQNELKEEILKARNELKDEIRSEIDSELKKHENLIDVAKNFNLAGIYYIQAVNHLDKKMYGVAFRNFFLSAKTSEKANNFRDFQNALENIKLRCLPNLSKEEIETDFKNWEKHFNALFSKVLKRDDMKESHKIIKDVIALIESLPDSKAEWEEESSLD